MKITYLGHSGFLAETALACYLFDYIRGELPDLPVEKPFYVFASHSHGDHFDPVIFHSEWSSRVTSFCLSSDIRKKYLRQQPEWMKQYETRLLWFSDSISANLYSSSVSRQLTADGSPTHTPAPDEFDAPIPESYSPASEYPSKISVSTLRSTDLGVAYLICEEGGARIYHAGDLNWWHWEGKAKSWNRNMEVNYKREIEKIRGWHIDAAFVPLDPRLDEAYWYGLHWFAEQVPARHIFPMHFWNEYGIIPKYLNEHPVNHTKQITIHQIHQEGEQYEI